MFGRKKWKLDLNVEGELQANAVSRKEGLPRANPEFDQYPVNLELPKKMTLKQAIQKAIEYGQAGIYSILYKSKRKPDT